MQPQASRRGGIAKQKAGATSSEPGAGAVMLSAVVSH